MATSYTPATGRRLARGLRNRPRRWCAHPRPAHLLRRQNTAPLHLDPPNAGSSAAIRTPPPSPSSAATPPPAASVAPPSPSPSTPSCSPCSPKPRPNLIESSFWRSQNLRISHFGGICFGRVPHPRDGFIVAGRGIEYGSSRPPSPNHLQRSSKMSPWPSPIHSDALFARHS